MKITAFLFFACGLIAPTHAGDLLYGFQLQGVASEENTLPVVKVSYLLMTRSKEGKLKVLPMTSGELDAFRKLIRFETSGKKKSITTWKFYLNKRYGLLTYRLLTKKERKALQLKKGIYLKALEVTQDIFQDQDLKQQIREAEESTSLEALLSQSLEEINATLEEKGGVDAIVSEMIQQEYGQLNSGSEAGCFIPVRRKN